MVSILTSLGQRLSQTHTLYIFSGVTHIFCRPETNDKHVSTPFPCTGIGESRVGFGAENTLISVHKNSFVMFNSLNVDVTQG